MPTLPLEIIESILSILAVSDFNSLLTTSLTCSAFVPLCRAHIFRSITLNSASEFENVTPSMLHDRLSQTPELAQYIRHLSFNMKEHDTHDSTIVLALQHLTHLRSLSIWHHPYLVKVHPEISWNKDPAVRVALRHILALPSLVELEIFAIHGGIFLSDLTSSAGALEKLTLELFLPVDLSSIAAKPTPSKPLKLRVLDLKFQSVSPIVHFCSIKCADGRPFLDFSRLTWLSLVLEEMPQLKGSQVGSIIERCTGLVELHITATYPCITLFGLTDAIQPSIHTLKRLRIHVSFNKEGSIEYTDINNPLTILASELDHVGRTDNILEEITLRLSIGLTAGYNPSISLRMLNKSFARNKWPMLRSVSLDVSVSQRSPAALAADEFKRLVKEELSWLFLNDSVLVNFEYLVWLG
ncbi:hypothetical protein BDN70DRAFT_997347 [Pholiota conissans]|uniref:F-box domain-containing protein n=1 Tax=Pholiota conissans TaxID=109636 RepID=A0A9P5YRX4_9AGAR|nr:hypothetical protein BDN70DRAFT_997347 [Pholiota conissans]